MPYYLPPDYLDNTAEHNMADTLNRVIQVMEERQLDVATGYFEPSAWEHLNESFPLLGHLRLLLGKEPEFADRFDETVDLRQVLGSKLQTGLEDLPLDAKSAALIDSLIAFLARESVQVRVYKSFLHAKAYLFSRLAIVGSSNLTAAGLNRPAELNLVRKEEAVAQALRQNWFEPRWREAEDYKADLIAALNASKFGRTEYTPFQVLIKALYEYFRERLLPESSTQTNGGVELATFQQEGLREAIRLLERHHGVLIADAVGLGKTYIGMGVLEHVLLGKRKRGVIPRALVVCPAQLRDLVWHPKLDEYGIKATVLSMEELGRKDFDWKAYNTYDLVLVDESHNFRNRNTQRYQNLNFIISTGKVKDVVLMTATPINNTIWDLYHQISLMVRGNDTAYREFGINNLQTFFKRVTDGRAELFDLLEESAVRRSRYDVKKRQEAGEEVILPGKGAIHFPERVLRSITYNLEQTYKGLYKELADQIEGLSLVSYNIEQYHFKQDAQGVKRNHALIGIMKITFLKRLESSLRAFEVSVKRQQQFQRRFFHMLKEGRLLDAPNHRKILAIEEEESSAESVDELIQTLPEVKSSEYDLAAIEQCLESDLKIFADMLGWIEIVREAAGGVAGQDTKLAALKAELCGALKGKKVLIFSYYQDTAHYLHDSLREDSLWMLQSGNPVMGLITGSTHGAEREQLVKRFSPLANTADGEEGAHERRGLRQHEIQLLISTDVLSEGQNLQDAGVLINYDLHWNPVRMIQRAGRIDRLGTPFNTLLVENCFPEQGLESLLHLVERLQRRIADIDRTVGLDASVLGEVIHPKSLEDLKRIKAGEREILDELEQVAELVSTDEMKLPLIAYLQSIGEQRLREIPLGIHSTKRSRSAGTFFAIRGRSRHFWRFYPADGSAPITDKRRIFKMLLCLPDEPRAKLAEPPVFDLLARAVDDIYAEIRAQMTATRVALPMTGLNKVFQQALNQHSLLETLPDELRERVNSVLLYKPLKPFERDPQLKALQNRYKLTGSVLALAEQLDTFFVDHELYHDIVQPIATDWIRKTDLQLVCYEVLG